MDRAKGLPIKRLTLLKSAAREAFEEAGVRGKIGARGDRRFTYRKTNGQTVDDPNDEVKIFPLLVERQSASRPESEQRVLSGSIRRRRSRSSGSRSRRRSWRSPRSACPSRRANSFTDLGPRPIAAPLIARDTGVRCLDPGHAIDFAHALGEPGDLLRAADFDAKRDYAFWRRTLVADGVLRARRSLPPARGANFVRRDPARPRTRLTANSLPGGRRQAPCEGRRDRPDRESAATMGARRDFGSRRSRAGKAAITTKWPRVTAMARIGSRAPQAMPTSAVSDTVARRRQAPNDLLSNEYEAAADEADPKRSARRYVTDRAPSAGLRGHR